MRTVAEWGSARAWSGRCGRGGGGSGCRRRRAVVSCYEAGRDGFWIHRALTQLGIAQSGGRFGEHRGESPRAAREDGSARCAETGADAGAGLLRRAAGVARGAGADGGGRGGAPGESRADGADAGADAADQSDARLAGDVGLRAAARAATGAWWTAVRDWAGAPLPAAVQARLARAEARLAVLEDADRRARGAAAGGRDGGARRRVRCASLVQLKGVATTSASVLLDEGLGVARVPQSARRSAGSSGFAPTPYRQRGVGARARDQSRGQSRGCRRSVFSWPGIGCAGNRSARSRSGIAAFRRTGKRARRIGIVAVARKLVIALWRYVTTGVVPAGAI